MRARREKMRDHSYSVPMKFEITRDERMPELKEGGSPMIGRQVITVNRPFTLPEPEQFMLLHWDKEEYGYFMIGKGSPFGQHVFHHRPHGNRRGG